MSEFWADLNQQSIYFVYLEYYILYYEPLKASNMIQFITPLSKWKHLA